MSPEPAAASKPPTAGRPSELGWLPDLVFTGEKFESGLAFFADAVGRITRFSREPADLAAARKLPGQAALPGLVNGHSVSWQRVLRGRTEQKLRAGTDDLNAWRDACGRVASRMRPDDVFEAARMAFTEMLLAGITCVGEFHELRPASSGVEPTDPIVMADAILRAARDVGIRVTLFNVANLRPAYGTAATAGSAGVDGFLRETETLRSHVAAHHAPDEAWLGVAPASLSTVPLEAFTAITAYAHAQRLRVQTRTAVESAELDACIAEYGRAPLVVLGEHAALDKRFTAVHGTRMTADECRVLGAARGSLCVCPTAEQNLALPLSPVADVLSAGAGLAFGTWNQTGVDLMREARTLEYALRVGARRRPALGLDGAKPLFHAATVTGARSLGATGGALEVGRPADFFTVNLYDASIAGADADTLLANVVFALERRAVREVWVGGRQRVVNGRHVDQGMIVGRFVEMQRNLWAA